MDLDEILDEVGHFGKFQAVNYALVGFPILLSAAFALSYVFTAGDLEYRYVHSMLVGAGHTRICNLSQFFIQSPILGLK